MDRNLLSTTDSIKGYEITEQKGVVTARVVVGVGFFSEFFAAFTDIFGGRSKKFEDKLEELYEEALAELEQQLIKKRCNAAIGIKCDFDEISGKGTLMFMVTLMGTAVKVTKVDEAPESPIISQAKGKSVEREIKNQNVLKIYRIIDDLLEVPKVVDLEIMVTVIATKPADEEKIDNDQLLKVIKYLNINYSPAHLTKIFIEKLLEFKSEKSQSFDFIYNKCVLPYFNYMTLALDQLDKKDADKYIRALEMKSRKDYTLDDVKHIDEYISKLTELGFDVDRDPKEDMLTRLYGFKSNNSNIAFVKDLRESIIQFYEENKG